MSATDCRQPLGLDLLVEYWLGDLDEARTDALDLHLLGCDACGARLDEIAALGEGVRLAFAEGLVGAVVGQPFAQRLAERGLRLREHSVDLNGSVSCSVAPDDEIVLARLRAPLAGVQRLDIVRRGAHGGPDSRAADVPFDAGSGEVVVVVPAARVRTMPSGVELMELVAVDAAGERVIGQYRFDHRTWPG